MLNPESKTPFRWYYSDISIYGAGSIETAYNRQQRWRSSADGKCYYKLYTHTNQLNPFQLFVPAGMASFDSMEVVDWFIYRCDYSPLQTPPIGAFIDVGAAIAANGKAITDYLEANQAYGLGVWQIYKGQILPVEIPTGFWYSVIILADGSAFVSEIFWVPCNESEFDTFTKLEWSNSCDFATLIYQTGYKNLLYLTSELARAEPSVVEEGITNGEGKFFQTSAIYFDNYKIEEYVPEYVMNALVALKMHDTVMITQPYNRHSGLVRNANGSINWTDSDEQSAAVTLEFQQEINLNKTGCCNNISFGSLIPIQAVSDLIYLAKATGANQYNFDARSNDKGYNIEFTNTDLQTLPFSGGFKYQFANSGLFSIVKPTAASDVAPKTIPYTIRDAFGNEDSAVLTLMFVDPTAVSDILGANLLPGGVKNFGEFSVLQNDKLPYYPGLVVHSYSVANAGLILSNAGDGSYIDINAAGNIIFYASSSPTYGSHEFEYYVKYDTTGITVTSAILTVWIGTP